MTDEDIVDPRVVPRWVEAGVSGVPRGREWDVVSLLELPEIADDPVSEIGFTVLEDGALAEAEGTAPPAVLERLAAEVRAVLRPPFEARAARRGRLEWSVAAREMRLEPIALPADVQAEELTVAVAPDGQRALLVDGVEREELAPALEQALERLELYGRARSSSFVARARRAGAGRWAVTIDPL